MDPATEPVERPVKGPRIGALSDDSERECRGMPAFVAPALAITPAGLFLLILINGAWLLWVPVIALFVRKRGS